MLKIPCSNYNGCSLWSTLTICINEGLREKGHYKVSCESVRKFSSITGPEQWAQYVSQRLTFFSPPKNKLTNNNKNCIHKGKWQHGPVSTLSMNTWFKFEEDSTKYDNSAVFFFHDKIQAEIIIRKWTHDTQMVYWDTKFYHTNLQCWTVQIFLGIANLLPMCITLCYCTETIQKQYKTKQYRHTVHLTPTLAIYSIKSFRSIVVMSIRLHIPVSVLRLLLPALGR